MEIGLEIFKKEKIFVREFRELTRILLWKRESGGRKPESGGRKPESGSRKPGKIFDLDAFLNL